MEYHYSLTGRMLGIFVGGLILLAILVFAAGLLAGREWGANEAAARIRAAQREGTSRAAPAATSAPVAVGAIGTSKAAAPAAPTVSPSPAVPAAPKTPPPPSVPKAPHLSAVTRAPYLPTVPKAPRLPVVPKAPHLPVVRKAPHLPAVAKAPRLPAAPTAPALQSSPEVATGSKPELPPLPAKTSVASGNQGTQIARTRDDALDHSATASAPVPSPVQPATPTKDEAVHGFVVYVGAFAASNTAQNLADNLQKRKLEAHMSQLQRPGRKMLYSVYVGPFTTRAGAEAVLPDLAAAGLDDTMIRKVP